MERSDRDGAPPEARVRDGANTSLIVMFGALILILAGWTIASQMGLFSDGGGGDACATVEGRSVHEHARLEVYLNSTQPYDFSPQKYQLQAQFLHLEEGQGDANGAVMHIHQSRPTLACFFDTVNWQVSEDRIVIDTGEVFEEDATHELEILVDGKPAKDGFETFLQQGQQWQVRYTWTGGSSVDDGGADDANETSGNATAP